MLYSVFYAKQWLQFVKNNKFLAGLSKSSSVSGVNLHRLVVWRVVSSGIRCFSIFFTARRQRQFVKSSRFPPLRLRNNVLELATNSSSEGLCKMSLCKFNMRFVKGVAFESRLKYCVIRSGNYFDFAGNVRLGKRAKW